jgi:hypothetical protein
MYIFYWTLGIAGVLFIVICIASVSCTFFSKQRRTEEHSFRNLFMYIAIGVLGVYCLNSITSEKTTYGIAGMRITSERTNPIARAVGFEDKKKYTLENPENTESEGFVSGVSKNAIMDKPKINTGSDYITEIGKNNDTILYKYKLPPNKQISVTTLPDVDLFPMTNPDWLEKQQSGVHEHLKTPTPK